MSNLDGPDERGRTFRILVEGVLGDEWTGRLHGMAVSVERPSPGRSHSELTGVLPDEAALMGVLETLYTYGARLLVVERVGWDQGRHGQSAGSEGTRLQ